MAGTVASRDARAKEAKASFDQVLMSAQKTICRGQKTGIHQKKEKIGLKRKMKMAQHS